MPAPPTLVEDMDRSRIDSAEGMTVATFRPPIITNPRTAHLSQLSAELSSTRNQLR